MMMVFPASSAISNEGVQSNSGSGLLDLSVDLSSPEIYSGTEFSVYLHIKNPFDKRIWIEDVTLSLPTQMQWNVGSVADKQNIQKISLGQKEKLTASEKTDKGERSNKIKQHEKEIRLLLRQIEPLREKLETVQEPEKATIQGDLTKLEDQLSDLYLDLNAEEQEYYMERGYSYIIVRDGSMHVNTLRMFENTLIVADKSSVDITDLYASSTRNRVRLHGTLQRGTALQPGSTDEWTLVLQTPINLLFIPTQYRLQFNVLYSFEPPEEYRQNTDDSNLQSSPNITTYSNTIAKTISIRASIWYLMIGATIGGVMGALAREMQIRGSLNILNGEVLLSMTLSSILSIAAIIFAARKAETQSFVSVEDFWGGALIGFLIGYSGTSAFQDLTNVGVPEP